MSLIDRKTIIINLPSNTRNWTFLEDYNIIFKPARDFDKINHERFPLAFMVWMNTEVELVAKYGLHEKNTIVVSDSPAWGVFKTIRNSEQLTNENILEDIRAFFKKENFLL